MSDDTEARAVELTKPSASLLCSDVVKHLKLPDLLVAHVTLVHVEVDPTPRMFRRAPAAI